MVVRHAPFPLSSAMYRQEFIQNILNIGGDMRALWIPNATDTTTTTDETRHGQTWTYNHSVATFDSSMTRIGNGYEVVFNGTDEEADTGNNSRYTFGDGAIDQPFSVFALVRVVAGTTFQAILSKQDLTTGSTKREWIFYVNAQEQPGLQLYDDSTTSAYIGRKDGSALTTNTRYFLTATYDGTGVARGIRVYVNAVRLDDEADSGGSGTYVAMENTAAPLQLAHILDTSTAADLFWTGRMGLVGLTAKELNVHEIWQMKEAINAYYDLSL